MSENFSFGYIMGILKGDGSLFRIARKNLDGAVAA